MNRRLAYPLLACRALAQRVLRPRPGGVTDYYRDGLAGRLAAATWQLDRHARSGRILEIGCGRDLHGSLVAAIRHGKRAIAFDVAPLADLALVNFTLAALGAGPVADLAELGPRYGVAYRVASDIVGIADGCDGAISTASFEHIPGPELRRLAGHLASTLPPGGVVSAEIDYRDHWSFLGSVPPDHFYHLSDPAFAVLNSPRMFQNRLRHRDVSDLFRAAGFAIVAEQTTAMELSGAPAERAPRFAAYTDAELQVATARVAWTRA